MLHKLLTITNEFSPLLKVETAMLSGKHPACAFFLRLIYFEREGKGGRKSGRETSMCGCLLWVCPQLRTWPATQACALIGNPTGHPLVHRLALNPLSHTSQGIPSVLFKETNKQNNISVESKRMAKQ